MALHSQSSNSQKACISIHHGSLLLDRWCLGDWVSCWQGGNTAPWHQKVISSLHNILQYTVCWLSDTSPQVASTWWPQSWCRTPWSSTTTSWWARWSPGRGWRRPCRGGRPGAGSTAATTPCTTLSAPLRTLGTNPSWPSLTTPSNWTTSEERVVKWFSGQLKLWMLKVLISQAGLVSHYLLLLNTATLMRYFKIYSISTHLLNIRET